MIISAPTHAPARVRLGAAPGVDRTPNFETECAARRERFELLVDGRTYGRMGGQREPEEEDAP